MKVVMGNCEGCGKEFDNRTGIGFCIICDLEIRAKEPSQMLKDLRWVYEGQAPQTEPQQRLKRIWDQEPDKFLNRLEKAERDYRAQMAQGKAKEEAGVPPVPPGEVDEGSERVEELLERLLKEAQP